MKDRAKLLEYALERFLPEGVLGQAALRDLSMKVHQFLYETTGDDVYRTQSGGRIHISLERSRAWTQRLLDQRDKLDNALEKCQGTDKDWLFSTYEGAEIIEALSHALFSPEQYGPNEGHYMWDLINYAPPGMCGARQQDFGTSEFADSSLDSLLSREWLRVFNAAVGMNDVT